MRHRTTAAALTVFSLLAACAAPSGGAAEGAREDSGLYEGNVREWVEAMDAGMERARLDLARRAMRRLRREPG
jgi:hypothetical protein